MINLNEFVKDFEAIVPIMNNKFIYNRKWYSTKNLADGWYKVILSGNDVALAEPTMPEFFTFKNVIKGYTFNNSIVFSNFDVAKRKYFKEVMSPLCLNTFPTFSSIEAIYWEDKKFYTYKINYMDIKILDLKVVLEYDEDINTHIGMTPELKTLFLFHMLEKQRILAEQEQLRLNKEKEEFAKTLTGRLIIAFNTVNAVILNYSVSGNNIVVDWKLKDSDQRYNSVINKHTFQVVECGFCMSGQDKFHSVKSMILTAKDYEEEDLIHITRERG
jgi:hypothetical protein